MDRAIWIPSYFDEAAPEWRDLVETNEEMTPESKFTVPLLPNEGKR